MNSTQPNNQLLFAIFDATGVASLDLARACNVSPALVTGWRQRVRTIAPHHLDILEKIARNALQTALKEPGFSPIERAQFRRMQIDIHEYGMARVDQMIATTKMALAMARDIMKETGDISGLYILRETIDEMIEALTTPKKEDTAPCHDGH